MGLHLNIQYNANQTTGLFFYFSSQIIAESFVILTAFMKSHDKMIFVTEFDACLTYNKKLWTCI